MLIAFFMLTFAKLIENLNGQAVTFDLHIDQNSYLLAAFYYMRALDQFLPITDAVVPLVAISFTIQTFFTIVRVLRFIKGFIPGLSGGF